MPKTLRERGDQAMISATAKPPRPEKRFKKVVLIKMTEEMYSQVREFAERWGLSVSAAIRYLVCEGLRREERRLKRTEREGE